MKKNLAVVLFSTVMVLVGCGYVQETAVPDDGWAAKRAAAVNRERVLVYNTDGNDVSRWRVKLPYTAGNFTSRRLKYSLGTHIDTVAYCPLTSGFGRFTCMKAGEPYCVKTHRGKPYATWGLFKAGLDPLQMASDFCATNKLEVFVSIRVNDTHDAKGNFKKPDPLFPDFKKNNPGCLMGAPEKGKRPPFCNWSAVNFAEEKVRAHMRGFVRDLVENYALDGIEYDFNRHMQLFKTVAMGGEATQAELDLMTGFMRELKEITEAAGRRRNRPVVIAIRTPDSPEYCRAVGIDLERWFKEKLVDIWIGGGYFCLNRWDKSAAYAHAHGIRFYASMDETRIQRRAERDKKPFLPGRMTPEFYAGRFADAMASGCDGVYVFNIEKDFLHRIAGIAPETAAKRETIRFAADRGSGGYRPWRYLKDGGRFNNLPKIDPGEPHRMSPGETYRFGMFIAGGSLAGGPFIETKLLTNLKDGESLEMECNGKPVQLKPEGGGVFACSVPDGTLKGGVNAFAVTVPRTVKRKILLRDFSIRIVPPVK